MNADLETYLELLEKRLALLHLLAREFVECRKEFVALDVDGMYRRIAQQEELCREIQRLQPGIHALQVACGNRLGISAREPAALAGDAHTKDRLHRILRNLGEAQAEVGRLNQIHAAYLRRSRRTILVLRNFIGSYAMTYSRPVEAAGTEPAIAEEV